MARWDETDHPRDPDGQFTDKPGGGLPDGLTPIYGPVRDAKPGALVEWDGQYRRLRSATRTGMDVDLAFEDGTAVTVGFGRQANIATPPEKKTRTAAKKPPKQPDWAAQLSHRIDENEYWYRSGQAALGDDAVAAAGYHGGDPELDDALLDYQSLGAASTDVNAWLRGEQGPPDLTQAGATTDPAELVRRYDRATQPSTADLTAYRGMGRRTFGDAWDTDLTGHTWDDHGYVSLSADEQIARQYADARGGDAVIGQYLIPAGTGTATIGHTATGDTGDLPEAFGETDAEILAQRRLRYRVVRDNRTTGGGLEITVVGSARR